MTKVTIGTVSAGTLRTEDLLKAFVSELIRLDPESASMSDMGEALAFLDGNIADEAPSELVDALQDILNELCPPFVYFGSHPGDGADFGFWPDMDRLEDFCRYTTLDLNTPGEYQVDDGCDVIVQVSDHGNILVMDMDRQELWSTV